MTLWQKNHEGKDYGEILIRLIVLKCNAVQGEDDLGVPA